MLVFSAAAGICGTGFGGIIAVFLGKNSSVAMCRMLSFAAGVMISIVCFGLVPEALDISSVSITIIGLVAGIIVIMILNRIIDEATQTIEDKEKLKIHMTPEEMYHEGAVLINRQSLLHSGFIMLVAIGLHNIPEGIAIGAGGSHNVQLGVLLAIMIALHNIPEGMSIAAPLLAGGISRGGTVMLTALSGAPTLLGGIIGSILGNISDSAIAFSLSAAGGAMLYVVFGEIIPQSIVMTKDRYTSLVTLAGILAGLLVAKM